VGTQATPVLIVGAGPVGAVLALELAHHKVPSMLVERSVRPSLHPKMDYVNGRTMELLRRLGLADLVRDRGIHPDHSMDFLWTRGHDESPVMVWHRPSVNQVRQRYAAVNDGTAPAEPYQRVQGSQLEALLRDAARRHPLVDLREGWTFSDLRQDDNGVTAIVIGPNGAGRQTVRARFLAGCDGSRSTVRRCLDIPVDTLGTPTQHLSVYFTSGDPALRRHGRAFVTIGPVGLTLVSRDEKSAWTASIPIPADLPLTANPISAVRERLGVDFTVDNVISVAQWEGSLSVATRYRAGFTFLVGDAAHQFYPTGGFGANAGVADAVDLGWKLAAVVNGWGGPHLLASYEMERRPAALFCRELCAGLLEVWRRFHRLTAAGASREQLAGVLEQEFHHVDNLGVQFGTRYTHSPVVWPERGDPPTWYWDRINPTTWPGCRVPAVRLTNGDQLLDLVGDGLSLVDLSGRGLGETLVKEARQRGIPMNHLPLAEASVRACWERDLVLVRPDQHVAWRDDEPPPNWDDVLDRVTGHRTT
jgi:2-polyprenyl-6-methoxyphenol hydroxylase-like FAD-dependent oxidoreductase